MRSKEELLEIAEEVADQILKDWYGDYHSWDGLIEDGDLSFEEWDWIQKNTFTTSKVGYK